MTLQSNSLLTISVVSNKWDTWAMDSPTHMVIKDITLKAFIQCIQGIQDSTHHMEYIHPQAIANTACIHSSHQPHTQAATSLSLQLTKQEEELWATKVAIQLILATCTSNTVAQPEHIHT